MRPPQNAGESTACSCATSCLASRFNEAPAERGGKSVHQAVVHLEHLASMRPPQNAGESYATMTFFPHTYSLQ